MACETTCPPKTCVTPCAKPCYTWIIWVILILLLIALIFGIIWMSMSIQPSLSLSGSRFVSVSDIVNQTDVTLRLTSSKGANEIVSVKGGSVFTFDHVFRENETYSVVIDGELADSACSVVNGNGTFGLSNIDSVRVQCSAESLFDPLFKCYKQNMVEKTASLYFGFSDSAASFVRLVIDSGTPVTVSLSGTSGDFVAQYDFVSDGTYSVTAEILDSLGAPISTMSDDFSVLISCVEPPTSTTLTSNSPQTIYVQGTFGTASGSIVQFIIDSDFCNSSFQETVTTSGGAFTATLVGIDAGTHTVHLKGVLTGVRFIGDVTVAA